MKPFRGDYPFGDAGKVRDPETRKALTALLRQLRAIVRDITQMPFNRSESLTVADTGTADTQFSVAHHLGRVPAGYVLTKTSKAADLYDGTSANTDTTLYLRCSAANAAVTVQVF